MDKYILAFYLSLDKWQFYYFHTPEPKHLFFYLAWTVSAYYSIFSMKSNENGPP